MTRRLIRKPYKGCVAYEWQIGPFVFQIPFRSVRSYECFGGRRIHAFRDPLWRGIGR